jgi:predicted Zn-dependent protease
MTLPGDGRGPAAGARADEAIDAARRAGAAYADARVVERSARRLHVKNGGSRK